MSDEEDGEATAYVTGTARMIDDSGTVLEEHEGKFDSFEATIPMEVFMRHGISEITVKLDLEAVEIEQ
jgi:hypothetical protein